MKISSIGVLNGLGFTNPAQRVYYAAKLLAVASYPSPAVELIPAVASTPTTPAIKTVSSPVINPLPPFFGTAKVDESGEFPIVEVMLPYAHTKMGLGGGSNLTIAQIGECTAPNLLLNTWLGGNASSTVETKLASDEPSTIERYFFKYAQAVYADLQTNGTAAEKAIALWELTTLANPGRASLPVVKIKLPLRSTVSSNFTVATIEGFSLSGLELIGTSFPANTGNNTGFMLSFVGNNYAICDSSFDYFGYAYDATGDVGSQTIEGIFAPTPLPENSTYQGIATGSNVVIVNGEITNSTNAVLAIQHLESFALIKPGVTVLASDYWITPSDTIEGIHLPI
jgi:hypothetical protein